MNGATDREAVEEMLQEIRDKLEAKGIPAKVHMECVYRLKMENGDNNCSSLAFSGVGDVTAEEYTYTQGDSPRCANEVAITKIIAEKLDVEIGDKITIYQDASQAASLDCNGDNPVGALIWNLLHYAPMGG